MEFLADLWIPIVLSSMIVFLASSVLHMMIPLHKGDYKKLAGEAKVLEEIRNQGIKPGAYAFPFPASMKEMGTPEMKEKYNQGPVGFLTVLPNGVPAMGKSLVQWFLFSLLIGVFIAYIASLALAPGTPYRMVYRVTGAIAVLAYAVPVIYESIWRGQSWGTTLKFMFDGVVYGLLTAGVFGWLWPKGM
jgi:hypothetical protein